MKRIKWIETYEMVSSFPLHAVTDHYKAYLRARGEDSRPVDNLSDRDLIEYAKEHMTRTDVAPLNFRCGFVNHHSWPESFKGTVFTDIETAWKESPFIVYDDPSWR